MSSVWSRVSSPRVLSRSSSSSSSSFSSSVTNIHRSESSSSSLASFSLLSLVSSFEFDSIKLSDVVAFLTDKLNNGEYSIEERCSELRRKVQLAKEEKILKIKNEIKTDRHLAFRLFQIEERGQELISQIDLYGIDLIRKYSEIKESKKEEIISRLNGLLEEQRVAFHQSKINDGFENKGITSFEKQIEREKEAINIAVFNNQILKFKESESTADEDCIGELICEKIAYKKALRCKSNSIKLIDLDSGECIKTFEGHTDRVSDVMILNDIQFVSCSEDKTVKIWNIETSECSTLVGHLDWVVCIEVFADNKVASGSFDNTIRVWNTKSGICLNVLVGHSASVKCIKKLSNNRLVSCSWDKTIKLWNLQSAECLITLCGHRAVVTKIGVLSQNRIFSSSFDNTIKVWNVNTGVCLKTGWMLIESGEQQIVKCIGVLSKERIFIELDRSLRSHYMQNIKDKNNSLSADLKIWCLKTNKCCRQTITPWFVSHSIDVMVPNLISNFWHFQFPEKYIKMLRKGVSINATNAF